MRYLVRLAFKNLWRQRRRTILTMLAISVGIICLIMADSLFVGFDNIGTTNLRDLETGDIQIHRAGYFEKRDELPIDLSIDSAAIIEALKQVDGVASATPRLVFAGRLNNGNDEIPVMAVGIDPATDSQVFTLSEHTEGKLPAKGAYEAAIGADLARIMDLGIGDYFTLVTRTKDEAFQALDFTVTGLIRSPHPQVNQNSVFIPYDVAASGLAMDGQATEIALRAKDGQKVEAVAKEIKNALAGAPIEVLTWREVAADFLAISATKKSFLSMLLFFIVLIAAVGVVNTILLGAMERKREIGMMKALGMTEKEIVQAFVWEAGAIGVLASVFGCLVAILGVTYLVVIGFDFGRIVGDIDIGYPIAGRVHGGWHLSMIATAFVFGVVVSVVASYFPARRAAQNDPIQSLRQA